MHKDDNKLALSVLATLTAAIALIYTLIQFHNIIFAVAGVSILFLISAYVLTQNIIAFSNMKNKSLNVHIKDCVDDISSQLEAMNGAQSQLGKANYIYTRQAAQMLSTLTSNYTESQEALYKNLATLSNAQNKATKLMIKYDQSNTTKVISTIKDLRNQLSETMIQGFDQIQPNNTEVVAILEDIVDYLKAQPGGVDQTMSVQLNNVAHELQNISNSIQRVQFPAQGMVQQVPVQTMTAPVPAAPPEEVTTQEFITPESIMETAVEESAVPEPASEITLETVEETNIEDSINETNIEETGNLELPEETVSEDTSSPEPLAETAVEETVNKETNSEPAVTPIADKNPNDMLTADEIAALFAAAEPTPKKEENDSADETAEEIIEDEPPFTPTFTVVGKSKHDNETEDSNSVNDDTESKTNDTPTIGDLNDPNKQLSPDEIAALFAAADPAPKKGKPAAEANVSSAETEKAVQPVMDDPNKQLSPDEIAALFAAAEPAPRKEDSIAEEEKKMDEAIAQAKPEPVNVTPISDDPNKQLSPDEIAALFASLG